MLGANMQYVTVKWFDTHNSLGFMRSDDGAGDVFVPVSAAAQPGMTGFAMDKKISFEIAEGQHGMVAALSDREGAMAPSSDATPPRRHDTAPLSILSTAEVREIILEALG
jgi:CspA family cold shock protein